jgi:hypothetical protein
MGRGLWVAWGTLTVGLTGWLGYSMFSPQADRRVFLPGTTTHGHYQIEMKCDACHTEKFGEVESKTCIDCHGAELKLAKDTHPASKFDDPRNADLLKVLNAQSCVTCHREHDPHATGSMGLTLPVDYCYQCHKTIGTERPSHKDFAFNGCAAAGCHNFHDNRALYQDFLVAHLKDDDFAAQPSARDFAAFYAEQHGGKPKPLTAADADALGSSGNQDANAKAVSEWSVTAHARGGVNCSACHGAGDKWVSNPSHESCKNCHDLEVDGFLSGRHGMRLAAGLPPMTPADARLPMKQRALTRTLNCSSCHAAHSYDTTFAAASACLQCHNDEHTLAYDASSHADLWKKEVAGKAPAGSGVSCASCHLPRETHKSDDGFARVLVQHNQNDNLRPNEKMIRSVCLQCHGLKFSIDSLADPELVRRNFKGLPSRHVESLDMAERHVKEKRERARKE